MSCLDCDSPYHRRCSTTAPTPQAGRPLPKTCTHPRCDGDTHYTGDRDPITNEDIEEGPCTL